MHPAFLAVLSGQMAGRLVLGCAIINLAFPCVSAAAPQGIALWGAVARPPGWMADVVHVSCGPNFTLVLSADGTVAGFGDNWAGGCSVPTDLVGATDLAASGGGGVALRTDGALVAWGGDARYLRTDLPPLVKLCPDIMYSDPGGWGIDAGGQPHELFKYSLSFPPPTTDAPVKSVVRCGAGALALKQDGTLAHWGTSGFPDFPPDIEGVISIAGSDFGVLALTDEGTVLATGLDVFGGPLSPPPPGVYRAISVAGIEFAAVRLDGALLRMDWSGRWFTESDVRWDECVALSGGGDHLMCLREDGTIEGLRLSESGYDSGEALGTGAFADARAVRFSPPSYGFPAVIRDDGRIDVPFGTFYWDWPLPPEDERTVADAALTYWGGALLRQDGTLRCWPTGQECSGALQGAYQRVVSTGAAVLGQGVDGVYRTVAGSWPPAAAVEQLGPVAVLALSPPAPGAPGHAVALLANGSVACVGTNDAGQCDVPAGLTDVVDVAAGTRFSVAVKRDGTVACWGKDGYGWCEFLATITGVRSVFFNQYWGVPIALLDDGSLSCPPFPTGYDSLCQTLSGPHVLLSDFGGGRGLGASACGTTEPHILSSAQAASIGFGAPITWTISDAPPSSSGATLRVTARGDFGSTNEFLNVTLDGQQIGGPLFTAASGATDCGDVPLHAIIRISPLQFARAMADGKADVVVTPSIGVGASACRAGFLRMFLTFEPDETDCDGDGSPDRCRIQLDPGLDCDANGLLDACEIQQDPSLDIDGTGRLDACQTDCNGNRLPDDFETMQGLAPDCNGNRIPDACDISSGWSSDIDGDLVPDECRSDCNNNGVPDAFEIKNGTASDCNDNLIIDACEIGSTPSIDCDQDGTLDQCEISADSSLDCDQDGLLDICLIAQDPDLDCDASSTLDSCQLAAGGIDCDANGRLDRCDLDAGAEDKNANLELDWCEYLRGDLNLDERVDGADLAAILSVWGLTGQPIGDLNRDGMIGGPDIAILIANWTS